jgi:hypothetical protein
MPCERKGYMVSALRINLLVVIKNNGFLKLKNFLKHDHFACQPTQMKSPIISQNLENNKNVKN